MTIPDLAEWVRLAQAHRGWSQAELGRQIDPLLPKDYSGDRSKINKVLKGRGLSAAEMLAIEAATGYPIPSRVPTRPDSFWPLFEQAEKLEGPSREMAYKMIKAAIEAAAA